jgi:hypothetical protein
LKQKGINGKAEVGAKSERAKWELEGKLPPFSAILFLSMVFFFFFCLNRRRCQEKAFEIEG